MMNRLLNNRLSRAAIICLAGLILRSSSAWVSAGSHPWPCGCDQGRVLCLHNPLYRGADVSWLQGRLAKLGIFEGRLDGIYGPQTASAVKEFQRRLRFEADGIVDLRIWAALSASLHGEAHPVSAQAGQTVLVVDLTLTTLFVLEKDRVRATFPVAIGKPGTPTPVGSYTVINKAKWGEGFGTRWLGLNIPWGTYGIHGTNKPWTIGGYESGGCIRLLNEDVEQLYDLVQIGTRVHIIGDPFYVTGELAPGETGAGVLFLQKRLRQLNFYRGPLNGRYDLPTERAVMAWQKSRGLAETGRVGYADFAGLRLRSGD